MRKDRPQTKRFRISSANCCFGIAERTDGLTNKFSSNRQRAQIENDSPEDRFSVIRISLIQRTIYPPVKPQL